MQSAERPSLSERALMTFRSSHSLTRRTLLRIATAAGLGIVVATVVSYAIIYDALEAARLELLSQYVVGRARREEGRFLIAESNHRVLKEILLKRLHEPAATDETRAWFEGHFRRTPDGALRSRRELVDPLREPSTWIRAGVEVNDELRRLVKLSHELCEQYFPAWRAQVTSLYISSPLQFNSGIAPPLPEWVWEIAGDFDQNAHEWGRLGSVAENPARASLWTGILFDVSAPKDVNRGAFVTLCTPVDLEGRHLLTLHHDVFFEELLDSVLRPERPGVTHAIFREDGRLIADAGLWDQLVAGEGRLSLQDSSGTPLHSIFTAIKGRRESPVYGYNENSGYYFAANRLRGPGWWFVSLLPRAQVRAEAFGSAQWVLWIGVGTLGFVLATLSLMLRREIAQPLGALLQATRQLASGQAGQALAVTRVDELGELATAFNEMTHRVTERDAELRTLNQSLEQRIEQRTLELRDSEARLRTLLDRSPIAIVTLDADTGRFLEANEHALRLLGVDRETLPSVGPAELSPPAQPDGSSSSEAAGARIAEALAGEAVSFEWLHRAPSGREIACEVHLARLPASGRRLLVGTLLDITLRKQAEAELLRTLARERELGQLKSEFVSMVSHEFRSPLEVIMTSGEILERYFDRIKPEKRREYLDAIHQSVRHMSNMMESVLLLSRVEAGTVTYQPRPLDLDEWASRLVNEIGSATNHACPIMLEQSAGCREAAGDPTLLHHIFGNLLSNAVKYSAPGTPVRFEIAREGDSAVFRVIDCGRGIPAADLPHLFRAFQRGRNIGQVAGTGLGLVIVKRCVDVHGGNLTCESEEGKGTTFVVSLPLFRRPDRPPRLDSAEPLTAST